MLVRHIALCVLTFLLLTGCAKPVVVDPKEPPTVGQPTPTPPKEVPPAVYDLVIRNGTIVDGSGSPGYRGDIAVRGDRIVAVGKLGTYNAARVINVDGLVVAPGFINPHSHTHDFINPYEDLDAVASLRQGITTEFGGVDGRSPLPIGQELTRISEAGTGVNFGLFVGQGSIRGQVIGSAWGRANPTQLEAMKQLVRQAMEEGAFGLSTGLEYAPGRAADQAEVTALATEVKPYGGIYSTHMRNEGTGIVEALREALAIAKSAGVPVNISHLKIVRYENWGLEDQVVSLIEQAIKGGQQVFADVYPYLAPDYAVNRPLSEWYQALPPEYLVITRAQDQTVVGKTLAEAAQQMSLGAEEAAERLMASDPGIAIVALVSSEQAMLRFYQAPWSVVATDGESQPRLSTPEEALSLALHRRSYGSYPALLGQYVRERQLLPQETVIRKMSGLVADHLDLKDRGYLVPDYYADIVIFDPDTVADRTTWLKPQEYPEGIRHVIINGQMAVQDGRWVEGRFGRVLRRGE